MEVDTMLRTCFFEDWMDDSEWDEFKSTLLKLENITEEDIQKQIDIGKENGHSFEKQLELAKEIRKKLEQ